MTISNAGPDAMAELFQQELPFQIPSHMYHGKPCRHGHGTLRTRHGNSCVECKRQKTKQFVTNYRATERGKKYIEDYRNKNLRTPEGLAKRRAYAKANHDPAKKRRASLRLNYGITEEEYDAMVLVQKNSCAICGRDASDPVNRWGRLQVDHCHKTGKVRGLLCVHCNHGLGKFSDDPSLLEKAARYLRGQGDG